MADETTREAAHGGEHPRRSTYWIVALILGIITVLEVAVFYVPAIRGVIVPVLLVLSTAKFTLVAMFFMHLKYDPRVLTLVLSGGLVVATSIIVSLMFLFGVIGRGTIY